jgi:hypothetical protein
MAGIHTRISFGDSRCVSFSTASVLVTTVSYKLVLLVQIVSTAYMICISGSIIYIPVLLYLNSF